MRTKTAVLLVAIPIAAALAAAIALPSGVSARIPDLSEQISAPRDRPGQARPATDEETQLRRRVASDHHLVATYYFEKSKDPSLRASDTQAYIEQGIEAENRALAADPDFFEALVYKNLLLREQAAREPDSGRQRALIREADALRTRSVQVRTDIPVTPPSTGAFMSSSPPPPPPPPPVPGAGEIQWVYAETSYTAEGNTRALTRIKDVRPVYAPMVMRLGVQGTVVVEASINHRGRVTDARIVESVPLLNQSVIDAVKQWQFDAATVNAAGDPILITVTARFVLPR